MDAIHIHGGNALFGETRIQGSKNAALPVMAAALLIKDVCTIENCPHISDVLHMQQLLQQLGCAVSHEEGTLVIDARNLSEDTMSGDNVTGMRSSITLLGAMLGRCREVTMAYPGGCVIGQRPIDIHLCALRKMGVTIYEKEGCFTARVKSLEGAVINLPISSVGATENVILAAVMAKGVTVLQNAAKEPEIATLCEFLREAGAVIEGIGGSVLIIQGGHELHGVSFRIPADRIVAGTYLMSVIGAGGNVFLEDAGNAEGCRRDWRADSHFQRGASRNGRRAEKGAALYKDRDLSGLSHGYAVSFDGGSFHRAGNQRDRGDDIRRQVPGGGAASQNGREY